MNKLIRTIHPEVKVIDAKKGIVDYVASDETLDSYREIIRADGWRFTHFKKNAPFVDSHDYNTIGNLLGKVTDFKVQDKQLVERVQWAVDSDSELAKLGFSLTEGGYLKAVSVGFLPKKMVSKWGNDQTAFQAAIADLKLPQEESANLRAVYLEQEQIELSACILGANPNALAKAHIDGAITDETLAHLGFDDDALQFLHESAAAYDQATPALRVMIRHELLQVTRAGRARSPSAPGTNFQQNETHRATRSDEGADDWEAIQRRRSSFLKELTAVTGRGD